MTRKRSRSDAAADPSPPSALAASTAKLAAVSRRAKLIAAASLVVLAAAGVVAADWWITLPDEVVANAGYVGRQTCAECHQQQHDAWLGSHHHRAMDHATDESVLGDFNDVEFTHHDVVSRFYRQDGKFMVRTEGPDGQPGDFEVKYVFGFDPLQQYMVEFDRPADAAEHEIARLQVLRLSWDTHRRQWFYLPPPDVDEKLQPDDDLHWTGVAQRWNNMCADCHSTNLQRNYDPHSQTYRTTYSEINVSCEACHGPGEAHVKLARGRSLFWDRKHGYGLARLKDAANQVEVETCAQCHARRRHVHPDFRPGAPYNDYFATELFSPDTYFPDGQILDEVYEHGSFTQSRMYHKNIRCTDCHDPHTARLKFSGNQVCTNCHQHPAGKYDSPSHHRHQVGSTGASCVECHMPHATYMEVDPRRDHSLRIPRPDLSLAIGSPNACTGCHLGEAEVSSEKRTSLRDYHAWLRAARGGDDEVSAALRKLDERMRDKVAEWYGPKDRPAPHFGEALAAGWRGDEQAADKLMALARDRSQPAIARASGLAQLSLSEDPRRLAVAVRQLEDPEPQVRAAALSVLEAAPNDELVRRLPALLEDPSRLVRTEAARILSRVPRSELRGSQRALLDAALEEWQAGLMVNNDRAGAHVALGVMHENQGDSEAARQAYELALRVEPGAVGPRTNLALLIEREAEQLEREAQQAVLARDRERALQIAERAAPLRYRIAELRAEELQLLARDARLAPDNAAVQYRYGLSLYLNGELVKAEAALLRAAELSPTTPDFVLAVALLYERLERWSEARQWTRQLLELRPHEPQYQGLWQRIDAAAPR